MRRTQLLLVVALTTSIIMLTAAVSPAVGITPSCRASVVRVERLLGLTLEPFAANPDSVPCQNDFSGLIPESTVGPVTLAVAAAHTFYDEATKNVRGQSTVVGVTIIPAAISALAVFATANGICDASSQFIGASTIIGLSIGGNPVTVPAGHMDITIPGVGTLHLNEILYGPLSVSVRSIWLDLAPAALPDVIVGEAHADC